jgi:hypothetical protein
MRNIIVDDCLICTSYTDCTVASVVYRVAFDSIATSRCRNTDYFGIMDMIIEDMAVASEI